MKLLVKYFVLSFLLACMQVQVSAQLNNEIEKKFLHPPESAKPWVFWYWMHGAVSKEGITADLEAMKEVGIGGAYLMPIQDTLSSIPFQPTVRQLTPEWWAMVKFSMQEAKRLGLQLAMHVSDGFALAGGPWITPELSMQKLVWTKTYINEQNSKIKLNQPETNEVFYKDVAVFAYPAHTENSLTGALITPHVTASNGTEPQFLCMPDKANKQSFKSDTTCWIQYQYNEPFTCRSIRIHVGGNSYQAQRLIIQWSNDGKAFTAITRLQPPRHGWQDTDEDYTYAIPATKARYFRFVYDKEGSEPGSEDLDAAKWKPSFKVQGIYVSSEAVINNYEAKNGSIWRIADNTTIQQVTPEDAVLLSKIINLTDKTDSAGNLNWTVPNGDWIVVRIGHTSTGHTNATGGAAIGLECDKFNIDAIKLQFDNWFAKAFEKTDSALAKEVLKVFHVDSWECGSQNWSNNFRNEFQKRRGYDLMPYLLVMTGMPINNAATSEKILHDVRQTIAELVNDIFYKTLSKLAHEKGCIFSAESIAPTMVSDGLLHYKNVDVPMGEFWLNSPTHDKPNDMLDAISGAHIYGKNIIQAEGFTSVRMNWGEHPGNLKTLGDRNFALGINRLVLHVFTHNPWMNKKPGMTLDGVGLYFQRDQTWFKQSKAWIDYLTRCQALLQMGKPVVDIAVFTGEEVPRRSVLPDRLVSTLPGIFGQQVVAKEKMRLANIGQPLRNKPDGVIHSANMADPEDWVDALNGYAYDSFNPDALSRAVVKNGRVLLPGGASYSILVFPEATTMNPNDSLMSLPVTKKILQLVSDGATIIISKKYLYGEGLHDDNDSIRRVMKQLIDEKRKKGKVIFTPYLAASFQQVGVQKDVEIIDNHHSVAWAHRQMDNADIYFVANQKDSSQSVTMSFPIAGKIPEIWNAVDKSMIQLTYWKTERGRTVISMNFNPNESYFILFKKTGFTSQKIGRKTYTSSRLLSLNQWQLKFDKNYGGPDTLVILNKFTSWSQHTDSSIKYYSGTAVYSSTFQINTTKKMEFARLEFDSIYNIATVKINGIDCGTLWTPPFVLDISKAVKQGENKIEIAVSNTWHNRLIGDNALPPEKRVTWTTAPFRLKDKPLLPAGIIGNIKLMYR